MFGKILKIGVSVVLGVTLLSACDGDRAPKIGIQEETYQGIEAGTGFTTSCIAADDFGYPKTNLIPSRPEPIADEILGEREDQVTYWLDTGFEADGNDLLVQTSGTWTSWFRGAFVAPATAPANEKYCILEWDEVNTVFTCPLTGMPLYNGTYDNFSIYMSVNHPDFNAPCWFTHGYSGYILFAPPGADGTPSDPNFRDVPFVGIGDEIQMKYPAFPTMHMFGWVDRTCTTAPGVNYSGEFCGGDYASGDIVLTELYQPLPDTGSNVAQAGDRIWARISDRYYEDNSGDYVFTFKRGARIPGTGPIESIVLFVSERILGDGSTTGLAQVLYEEIINDATFQRVVYTAITLYIILTGYSFMIRRRMSQGEFVARIMKIGVMFALIQPDSWEFFYEFLFQIFIEGTLDLIAIVIGAATGTGFNDTGYTDMTSGPRFFDDLLRIFFSRETLAKMHAALFYNAGVGFFVLIAFYVSLGVFLLILLRLVFVYILGIIPIGILIIIAPLFILFFLFDFTRKYFQNWIGQLLSASMQLFMASAMLALVSAVILDYLQRTVGYRVCWKCWWCPRIDFGWVYDIGVGVAFFSGNPPTGPREEWKLWFLGMAWGSEPAGFKFWQPDIRHDPALHYVTEAIYTAPGNQRYYDEYYPGYMGYIFLDWDGDGHLEDVFRNPLDLPFYDAADITAGSERGREALNYKLDGNLLTIPDVIVFVLIMLVFLIFSQQVPAIAMGLANVFFGINYGDAAGHMLKAGRQIGRALFNSAAGALGSSTSGARRAIGTRVKGAAGGAGAALFDWDEGLAENAAQLRDEYEQLRKEELNAIKRENVADLNKMVAQREARGKLLASEMDGNKVTGDREASLKRASDRATKRANINDLENANFKHTARGQALADDMNENKDLSDHYRRQFREELRGIKKEGQFEQELAAGKREIRGQRLADEMDGNRAESDRHLAEFGEELAGIKREGDYEADVAQAKREIRSDRLARAMDENKETSDVEQEQYKEKLRDIKQDNKFDAEKAARLREVRHQLLTAELAEVAKENIKGMHGLDAEKAASGRVKNGLSTGVMWKYDDFRKNVRIITDKKDQQVKTLAKDLNAVNKALGEGGGLLQLKDLNEVQRELYDKMVDKAAVIQGQERYKTLDDASRTKYEQLAAKELGRSANDEVVTEYAHKLAGLDQVSDDQDLLRRNMKQARDEVLQEKFDELEESFINEMKTNVGGHFGGSLKNQDEFAIRVAEKYRELAVDDVDIMKERLARADQYIAKQSVSADTGKTLARELKGANDNMEVGFTKLSTVEHLAAMRVLSDLDLDRDASKEDLQEKVAERLEQYKGDKTKASTVKQLEDLQEKLQEQKRTADYVKTLDAERREFNESYGRFKLGDVDQIKALKLRQMELAELKKDIKHMKEQAYSGVGGLVAGKEELRELEKLERRLNDDIKRFDKDFRAQQDGAQQVQRRKSNNSDAMAAIGRSGKHSMDADQRDAAHYARMREVGLESLQDQQDRIIREARREQNKRHLSEEEYKQYTHEQFERFGLYEDNRGLSFEQASEERHMRQVADSLNSTLDANLVDLKDDEKAQLKEDLEKHVTVAMLQDTLHMYGQANPNIAFQGLSKATGVRKQRLQESRDAYEEHKADMKQKLTEALKDQDRAEERATELVERLERIAYSGDKMPDRLARYSSPDQTLGSVMGDINGRENAFVRASNNLDAALSEYDKVKQERDEVQKELKDSRNLVKANNAEMAEYLERNSVGLATVSAKELVRQAKEEQNLQREFKLAEAEKESLESLREEQRKAGDADAVDRTSDLIDDLEYEIDRRNEKLETAQELYQEALDKAANSDEGRVELERLVQSSLEVSDKQAAALSRLDSMNAKLTDTSKNLKEQLKDVKATQDAAMLVAGQASREQFAEKLERLERKTASLDIKIDTGTKQHSRLSARHENSLAKNPLSQEAAASLLKDVDKKVQELRHTSIEERVASRAERIKASAQQTADAGGPTVERGERKQVAVETHVDAVYEGRVLDANQQRAETLGLGSSIAAAYEEITHLEDLSKELHELARAGVPVEHKMNAVRAQLLEAHDHRNSLHSKEQKKVAEQTKLDHKKLFFEQQYKIDDEQRRVTTELENTRKSHAEGRENSDAALKTLMEEREVDNYHRSLVDTLEAREQSTFEHATNMDQELNRLVELHSEHVDALERKLEESKERVKQQTEKMSSLQIAVSKRDEAAMGGDVFLYTSEALGQQVKANARENDKRVNAVHDSRVLPKSFSLGDTRKEAKASLDHLSTDVRTLKKQSEELENELQRAKLALSSVELKAAVETHSTMFGNESDSLSTVSVLSGYKKELEQNIKQDTKAMKKGDDEAEERLRTSKKQLDSVNKKLSEYHEVRERSAAALTGVRNSHKQQIDQVQRLSSKGSNKGFSDGRAELRLKRELAGEQKERKVFGKNLVLSDAKTAAQMADSALGERSRIHDFTSSAGMAYQNAGTNLGRAYEGAKGATYDAIKGGAVGVRKGFGSVGKGVAGTIGAGASVAGSAAAAAYRGEGRYFDDRDDGGRFSKAAGDSLHAAGMRTVKAPLRTAKNAAKGVAEGVTSGAEQVGRGIYIGAEDTAYHATRSAKAMDEAARKLPGQVGEASRQAYDAAVAAPGQAFRGTMGAIKAAGNATLDGTKAAISGVAHAPGNLAYSVKSQPERAKVAALRMASNFRHDPKEAFANPFGDARGRQTRDTYLQENRESKEALQSSKSDDYLSARNGTGVELDNSATIELERGYLGKQYSVTKDSRSEMYESLQPLETVFESQARAGNTDAALESAQAVLEEQRRLNDSILGKIGNTGRVDELRKEYKAKYTETYQDLDGNDASRLKQDSEVDVLHQGRVERVLSKLQAESIAITNDNLRAEQETSDRLKKQMNEREQELQQQIKESLSKQSYSGVDEDLTDSILQSNELAKAKMKLQRSEETRLGTVIESLEKNKSQAVTEGERNLLDQEIERKQAELTNMKQDHYQEQLKEAEKLAGALHKTYQNVHNDMQGSLGAAGGLSKDDILADILTEHGVTENWKANNGMSVPSVSFDDQVIGEQEDSMSSLNELLLSDKEYKHEADAVVKAYETQEKAAQAQKDVLGTISSLVESEEDYTTSDSARKVGANRKIGELKARIDRRRELRNKLGKDNASQRAIYNSEIADIEAEIKRIEDENGL